MVQSKLAKKWNQPPVTSLNTWEARLSARDLGRSSVVLLLLTATCLYFAGSSFVTGDGAGGAGLSFLLTVAAYAAAGLFGIASLKVALLVPGKIKPPKWVTALDDQQKVLLGVGAPPAAAAAAAKPAAAAAQGTPPPLRPAAAPSQLPKGPPKRTPTIPAAANPSPTSALGCGSLYATTPSSAAAAAPAAGRPGVASPSPLGGSRGQGQQPRRLVVTPERLSPLLDAFDREAQPPAAAPLEPQLGYGQLGYGSSGYPYPYPPPGGSASPGLSAASGLPMSSLGGGGQLPSSPFQGQAGVAAAALPFGGGLAFQQQQQQQGMLGMLGGGYGGSTASLFQQGGGYGGGAQQQQQQQGMMSPGMAGGGMPTGGGGSPMLLLGPSGGVPRYRQTGLPAHAALGSPLLRPDGRLALSSPDHLSSLLQQLDADRATLECWIEGVREWLASAVLQPLVGRMDAAAGEVVAAAQRLSWSGVQLSPLGAGGAQQGKEADDEVLLAQMREQLLLRLRTQPHVQSGETQACLGAVNSYQRLALLLRGEYPRALLPPTPRGYVASRVRTLATSPCVGGFQWDSGGSWQGRPWSPELPTDSALLLYLFAAYLEAPGWQFPLGMDSEQQLLDGGAPGGGGGGAPLYLGVLPPRPAQGYLAILPTRPPATPKATAAVLGLGLGSPTPVFSLLVDGQPAVALSSHTSLFTALLLFCRIAMLRCGGSMGGRSLQLLGLVDILRRRERQLGANWFGLW